MGRFSRSLGRMSTSQGNEDVLGVSPDDADGYVADPDGDSQIRMATAHQATNPLALTTLKATSRIILGTAHRATNLLAF